MRTTASRIGVTRVGRVVGKIIERNWVRLMTDVILTEVAGGRWGGRGRGAMRARMGMVYNL